jgi:hypothetical protein
VVGPRQGTQQAHWVLREENNKIVHLLEDILVTAGPASSLRTLLGGAQYNVAAGAEISQARLGMVLLKAGHPRGSAIREAGQG